MEWLRFRDYSRPIALSCCSFPCHSQGMTQSAGVNMSSRARWLLYPFHLLAPFHERMISPFITLFHADGMSNWEESLAAASAFPRLEKLLARQAIVFITTLKYATPSDPSSNFASL